MQRVINNWPILILVVLSLLVVWPLFLPGYFSHHDDLHVMRIFEMRKCIVEVQIPCRWVPDLGFGNGYPLFNYYSVLPYYIGAVFSFAVGYIAAAKLLFVIPLVLGALSMYLLAREIFGKVPAILAAVLFSFAPYKALDLYVRGAVAESWAMALIPLTFYFALKLIRDGDIKYLVGLVLSLASFLLSHNIMTLLFIPVLLIFIINFAIQEKWKNVAPVLVGLSLGIGLSSFFIFPAYFEKDLVQIDNLIRLDLNFRAHFVTLNQLFFSRFWGFGASSPGTNDTISFQIGWPHWWIVIVSAVVFSFNLIRKRKFDFLSLILISIFLFSIFMTHIKSAFIWEKIEVLKFTQFPWRFLSVAIFISSLLGAYLIKAFKENRVYLTALLVLTVVLNWGYFRPAEFHYSLTDKEKLSGQFWEIQQRASILDYLPVGAIEPKERAKDLPIIEGKANIKYFKKRSSRWNLKINVESNSLVTVPVFDFPNWQVFDGDELIKHSKDEIGRITIFLEPGQYLISARFTDTPIRRFSNIATLMSLGIILYIIFYGKIRKVFK